MDTSKYYQNIRIRREELAKANPSGFLYVISLDSLERNSVGGSICEVSIADAARLMIEGTHRVTTEEELAAYRAQQDAVRVRNSAEGLARARAEMARVLGGIR